MRIVANNIERTTALAGISGPVLFGAMDAIAAMLDKGYGPIIQSISSLALGPLGWVQATGFYALGLLLMVLCSGLCRSVRGGKAMFYAFS